MRSANLRAVPLEPVDDALVQRALEYAEALYRGQTLSTGESTWDHARGLAANLAAIGVDAAGRAAGILFAAPKHLEEVGQLTGIFGKEISDLALGVVKLYELRVATRASP
jgi:GTP pyrophosphokinase